jgi:hypothetical protein
MKYGYARVSMDGQSVDGTVARVGAWNILDQGRFKLKNHK